MMFSKIALWGFLSVGGCARTTLADGVAGSDVSKVRRCGCSWLFSTVGEGCGAVAKPLRHIARGDARGRMYCRAQGRPSTAYGARGRPGTYCRARGVGMPWDLLGRIITRVDGPRRHIAMEDESMANGHGLVCSTYSRFFAVPSAEPCAAGPDYFLLVALLTPLDSDTLRFSCRSPAASATARSGETTVTSPRGSWVTSATAMTSAKATCALAGPSVAGSALSA